MVTHSHVSRCHKITAEHCFSTKVALARHNAKQQMTRKTHRRSPKLCTTRHRSAKRHDGHYDVKGGVSSSYLHRPLLHDHDQLKGVRIGEAANPGPPGPPTDEQEDFLKWEMETDEEPAQLIDSKKRKAVPVHPTPRGAASSSNAPNPFQDIDEALSDEEHLPPMDCSSDEEKDMGEEKTANGEIERPKCYRPDESKFDDNPVFVAAVESKGKPVCGGAIHGYVFTTNDGITG